MTAATTIILASRSPYRAELLQRLIPSFSQRPADVDESLLSGERPEDYVDRLSHRKAEAIAHHESHPCLVIGSDQAAVLDGEILGKPGSLKRGIEMLSRAAGREVTFYTGLHMLDTVSGQSFNYRDLTRVHFRDFSAETAKRYLQREPALDCAGGFRCEGLGINLFEAIDNQDPTALIGLPLIAVARGLRSLGFDPLQ
ncbi:septum formation protein [Natronospira proteinivora]|uniref:7-methyl-GTP pyrophosphatase n=1 Tax=Natronospira proteinivora TaxID=1807133 RepID=A0ABT1G5Z1_9GAMM|nr:nucleoside triphosphate pyrophosphatase [Natronospira proteinivora]MCP1726714.1 septum formation protein [Natronospira proteinivora]